MPAAAPADLGSLIADTGHPHFPHWQLIALAAILAAALQAATPDPAPARLPRPARAERIVRTGPRGLGGRP